MRLRRPRPPRGRSRAHEPPLPRDPPLKCRGHRRSVGSRARSCCRPSRPTSSRASSSRSPSRPTRRV
eukprot:303421-Prymnesium_polylepis.1